MGRWARTASIAHIANMITRVCMGPFISKAQRVQGNLQSASKKNKTKQPICNVRLGCMAWNWVYSILHCACDSSPIPKLALTSEFIWGGQYMVDGGMAEMHVRTSFGMPRTVLAIATTCNIWFSLWKHYVPCKMHGFCSNASDTHKLLPIVTNVQNALRNPFDNKPCKPVLSLCCCMLLYAECALAFCVPVQGLAKLICPRAVCHLKDNLGLISSHTTPAPLRKDTDYRWYALWAVMSL